MNLITLVSLFALATCSGFAAVYHEANTQGFTNPKFMASVGGTAACITGYVNVSVTVSQTKLLYTGPANNIAAVQTVIELVQANPTIYNSTNGGTSTIVGTYNIYAKLCVPTDLILFKNLQTVHLLTHGATSDMSYWEISKENSYIDAAVAQGYATFSYDRLGVGKSDHPDPIQVVQAPIHVEIAHQLVQQLRPGTLGARFFPNVVGVGHSAGSAYTRAVTAKYPTDFNATILQSASTESTYSGATYAAFDIIIANTDPSGRFNGIANGYLTQGASSPQSVQFPFYHYPGFDPKILDLQYSMKQTFTIGELLTIGRLNTQATKYTRPVNILLGQYDFPSCGGDCTYPKDQAAAARAAFYPNSQGTSPSYLVPNSSHNINGHYSANLAFAQMNKFLSQNGI